MTTGTTVKRTTAPGPAATRVDRRTMPSLPDPTPILLLALTAPELRIERTQDERDIAYSITHDTGYHLRSGSKPAC